MKSAYHSPPAAPMAAPWLVFTNGKGIAEQQLFYNSCEPNNKIHKRNIPEMNPSWFNYFQSPSNQGWLIVYCRLNEQYLESRRLKYGDCFLWNPVSLKKIWLPSLHGLITYAAGYVKGGVLSAPPTIDNDSVVYFLLAIITDRVKFTIEYSIVFCRPADKQWRSQTLPDNVIPKSITCFKGKLHVLYKDYSNMNLVIEKHLGFNDGMSLSKTTTVFPVAQETSTVSSNRDINLLESRDELFVVVVDYHHYLTIEPRRYEDITNFQVFRMNFALKVLEKVKNLGDHVLFLGGRTKASCSATDLGLTRGHVYFTMPKDKIVYMFDLQDGTISYDIAFSDSMERCFQQAEWLGLPTGTYIEGNCRVNADEDVSVEAEPNIKTSVQGNNDKKECSKTKNEGGTETVKSETNWGSLDMDIIELIASYLHAVDYTHFRAVCKTHRSVASTVRKKTTPKISHTTSLSPWLILHQNDKDCAYRFVNPMHNNETYFIHLSEFLLDDATILCSKGGWLLMSKSCKRNLLFFFNPFTRDVIELPELPDHSCDFEGISFSSIPTSSDCTVFSISGDYSEFVYTSCISRGDGFWRHGHFENTKSSTNDKECLRFNLCRTNPVFHNGRFYCLDTRGRLGVFDLHSELGWEVLDELEPACTSYHQNFLVECEGHLLSIFVLPLRTMPVQIFKLDSSEKTKRLAWVEVRDLGKYMVFVSHTCCIAAIAPVSRMKNKIYFPRLHNERIVFFSLDTCRYQTLFLTGSDQCSSSTSSFYSTKKHLYCTWIEPNWSGTTTATELVWS